MTKQPNDLDGSVERHGLAEVARRSMIVLGSTAAFGLAGYLATLLVPIGYTAKLGLDSSKPLVSRDHLAQAIATEPLAAVSGDGTQLRVAASAATEAEARSIAEQAAARIEARLAELSSASAIATRQPNIELPTVPQETASATGKEEIANASASAKSAADLRASAKSAREEAAGLEKRIATLEVDLGPNADQLASAIAAETKARAAQSSIDRLRAAISSSRAGQTLAAVSPPPNGWAEWVRLSDDRARLQNQVSVLSKTLLDGHPRMAMARLRLADLDTQVRTKQQEVMRSLDIQRRNAQARVAEAGRRLDALRAAALDAEKAQQKRREYQQQRDVALRLAERLEASADAIQAALTQPAGAPPTAEAKATRTAPSAPLAPNPPASLPPEFTRTWMPSTPQHADPIPVSAASALFGFLFSAVGLFLIGNRRHGGKQSAVLPTMPHVAPNAFVPDAPRSKPFDVTPIDDVIDAAISSNVSRIMLAGETGTTSTPPLAVNIARRLSLRGQSVALVDMSDSQAAARTMGVGANAPTITDLIEGRASFASVAARDFATQAEIVPGGTSADGSPLDASFERRNVLDFVEKSYEAIIVDCTGMTPDRLASMMDADAALLVAVDASSVERAQQRIDALKQVGLGDMILVSENKNG